jgi:hypothetical protein
MPEFPPSMQALLNDLKNTGDRLESAVTSYRNAEKAEGEDAETSGKVSSIKSKLRSK